jgi:hypothetical protein
VSLSGPDRRGIPVDPERTERGTLSFSTPEGTFHVAAGAPGWKHATQGPFEPESVPGILVFRLERATGIRGRVTVEGAPAAGARVHAHRVLGPGEAQRSDDGFHVAIDGPSLLQALAGEDGRFFLSVRSEGDWVVHAELAGRARASRGPIRSLPDSDVEGVELELERGGAIEGRVLVADGVDVRGTLVGASDGDAHVVAAKVGADGTYRFEHLAPGRWQVRRCDPELFNRTESGTFPSARGAPVEWDVELRAGETARFDLDLRHRIPSVLTGSLRLGEAPLDGWAASLRVGSNYARGNLDREGRFRIDSPEPGELDLRIYGSGAAVRPRIQARIDLAPRASSWSLALETGSIELSGLPHVSEDPRSGREPRFSLVWRNDEGVTWTASILASDGSPLAVAHVPAGRVELRDASAAAPLLELDIVAGRTTVATVP